MSQAAPTPLDLLVIEDSDEMFAMISFLLKREGFLPRVARTGKEGVAAFAARPPDLVVMDLGLPDVNGEVVFESIRKKSPGFPCVVLTANHSLEKAIELMRAGAADYIIKPIVPDAFVARMNAVRDRLLLQREWEGLHALYEGGPRDADLVIGTDPAMATLMRKVSMIARTDAPVLLTGESGTGKERVARALHHVSRRQAGPFVAVNLGAIPLTLWESEFFGHVRGAFTDAKSAAAGLVARAENGTLFLDEVGECPPSAQAKLLRFLQEREYRPIGGAKDLRANVRVVAATNRDLRKLVQEGLFREDLFYRLNVIPVHVPPLRERRSDIPLLAQHFLQRYATAFEVPVQGFTPAALASLTAHSWPGNVRELENLVQQAVATASQPLLGARDLPVPGRDGSWQAHEEPLPGHEASPSMTETDELPPLTDARDAATSVFERRYLERVLALADGNITQAARMSRVPRKTFWRLLQKHKIAAVRDGKPSKPGRPRATKAHEPGRNTTVVR